MTSFLTETSNTNTIQSISKIFIDSINKHGFKVILAALILSIVACCIKISKALTTIKELEVEKETISKKNKNLEEKNQNLETKNKSLETDQVKLESFNKAIKYERDAERTKNQKLESEKTELLSDKAKLLSENKSEKEKLQNEKSLLEKTKARLTKKLEITKALKDKLDNKIKSVEIEAEKAKHLSEMLQAKMDRMEATIENKENDCPNTVKLSKERQEELESAFKNVSMNLMDYCEARSEEEILFYYREGLEAYAKLAVKCDKFNHKLKNKEIVYLDPKDPAFDDVKKEAYSIPGIHTDSMIIAKEKLDEMLETIAINELGEDADVVPMSKESIDDISMKMKEFVDKFVQDGLKQLESKSMLKTTTRVIGQIGKTIYMARKIDDRVTKQKQEVAEETISPDLKGKE